MEKRINWLLFSVKTGSPLGGLPAALQAKFQAQQSKLNPKKRSNPSEESSANPKKQNQSSSSNSSSKSVATFEPPSNWKIPCNKAYAKIFTPAVISKIPTIDKDGEPLPFCNVLFSKGWCRKGKKCGYCHDEPAKHGKKEAMDEYFRTAYENA